MEVQQIVQLASFLEGLHLIVIPSVFVVHEDNRQRSSAGLLEDGLPVFALHNVHRDPGLEVGPQMHLLGLKQTLQVNHVVSPLLAAGGGRIEYTDFAFSSQADGFQHSHNEDAAGDVKS